MSWGFRALEIKVINPGSESNSGDSEKSFKAKVKKQSQRTATTAKQTFMQLFLK